MFIRDLKMKKSIILLIFIIFIFTSSCSKNQEIVPEKEVIEEFDYMNLNTGVGTCTGTGLVCVADTYESCIAISGCDWGESQTNCFNTCAPADGLCWMGGGCANAYEACGSSTQSYYATCGLSTGFCMGEDYEFCAAIDVKATCNSYNYPPYNCWWGMEECTATGTCTPTEPEEPVDNCLIITEGNKKYALSQSITNSAATICIDVRASNLTLDCKGYTVDGIDNSGSIGINFANYVHNVTIEDCVLNDWYRGFSGVYNDYIEITNATITSCSYVPIYLSQQNHPRLYNSTIINNANYVYYYLTKNGIYSGNTIVSPTYGFISYGSGTNWRNDQIINNNITSNYPIYMSSIYNVTVRDNILNAGTAAMFASSMTSSYYVKFYNNIINCKGSKCINMGAPSSSKTTFNTTPTETPNIMGGTWMSGNYWTNPSKTGYSDKCADADENGLCDAAYAISNTQTYVYWDYNPISNVTVTFSQTFSSPANNTYVGPYPQIIVNVRANVGWKNSTMYYRNETSGWIKMIDCSNTTINGLVNINYKCIWNNSLTNTGEPGYDVKIVTYDKANKEYNLTNHYYVDLTLPQTAYVEADFPEYPYSRFRPEVSESYVIENGLSKLDGNNNDIQGYYNFDTDTVIVEDKIGTNNGTLVAGASITDNGKYGKGVNLDGINDYVDLSNSIDFNFTNAMTLSAFVKTTSEGYVITKDPDTGYVYRDVQGTIVTTGQSWNYFMGYKFTPQQSGGTITEICGYWSGTKTVKIQNAAYTVLHTDTLSSSNSWSCKAITPIVLVQGQVYYIGVNIAGSGGVYANFVSPRTSNAIIINNAVYQSAATQFTSPSTTTYYMYGMVDFKVSYGKGQDYPYSLSTHNNGTFSLQSGGTEYTITSNKDITNGEWHLLTATYKTGNMSLYIDGVIVNSTDAFSGSISTNTLPVWVGRSYNPTDTTGYFNGQIDEVMLLNRTLTPEQVLELNNSLYTRFKTKQNYSFSKNITAGSDLIKVTTNFYSYEGSSVNLTLGYYTTGWHYFESRQIISGVKTEFTIPINANNITLNYTLYSDNGFYTPEIYGNITLESASTSSARQTSIRDGQTLILRVNASDSNTGIDFVAINLFNINGSQNETMSLQSGSQSAGEWGYFNLTIPNVNGSDSPEYAPVYAWDNVGNMRGSDTFEVFFDNTPTDINYFTNLTDTYVEVGTSVSISWSVSDSSPLSPNGYYILSNNITTVWNNDTQGYLNEDGNGEAIFDNVQLGNHSYQLTTYDDSGNPTTTSIYTFEVTDAPPIEVVIMYPNNGSVFGDRNQSISFQTLYLDADNCTLFNNNAQIQFRNDTNESDTTYYYNYTMFNYGENILRVDCMKDDVTYSSQDVYMNITKYQLGILLLDPTENFTIRYDNSFNLGVNVSCTIMNCSMVNVTLNYDENNFTIVEDKMQNFSLSVNQSVIVNWTITALGKNGQYPFSAQVKQEDFDGGLDDYENITQTIYVNISYVVPKLNISFYDSAPHRNVSSNRTFIMSFNVSCLAGVCGNTSIYLDPIQEGNWAIINGTHTTFQSAEYMAYQDLIQINSTHYLVAFTGGGFDGFAQMIRLNSDGSYSFGNKLEFDTTNGYYPRLALIDNNHVLVTVHETTIYAFVLTINDLTITASGKTQVSAGSAVGVWSSLTKMNDTIYISTYKYNTDTKISIIKANQTNILVLATLDTLGAIDTDYASTKRINDTDMIISYQDTNGKGSISLLKLKSDNTLSAYYNLTYATGSNEGQLNTVSRLGTSDYYINSYKGASNYGYVALFKVNPTNITFINKLTLLSETLDTPFSIDVDDNHALIVTEGIGNTNGYATLVETNTTGIINKSNYIFTTDLYDPGAAYGKVYGLASLNDTATLLTYLVATGNDGKVVKINYNVTTVLEPSGKGLVNTTPGATPFWTITNPKTIILNENESEIVSFTINATGGIGTNYTFFAYANITDIPGINNISDTVNVTITEYTAPVLSINKILPFDNYTQIEHERFFNVTVNVSCSNSDCGEVLVYLDPITGCDCSSETCQNTECGSIFIPAATSSFSYTSSGYFCYDDYTGCVATTTGDMGNDIIMTAIDASCDSILGAGTGDCAIYIDSNMYDDYACPSAERKGSVVTTDDCVHRYQGCGNSYRSYSNLFDLTTSFFTGTPVNTNKTGLVNTTHGTLPFWTITNPVNITLTNGESRLVSFMVNASAEPSSKNYTFFAYANLTIDETINAISNQWNISIINRTYPAITITNINPTSATNFTYMTFNEYTVEVCCYNSTCGQVNVSLDPTETCDASASECSGCGGLFTASTGSFTPGSSAYCQYFDENTMQSWTTYTDAWYGVCDTYAGGTDSDCASYYQMDSGIYCPSYVRNDNVAVTITDCNCDMMGSPIECTGFESYIDFSDPFFAGEGGPTSAVKTGLINSTPGATPFWSIEINPQNITLEKDECENVTWHVNATGQWTNETYNATYEFFAFANITSDMSRNAITDKVNITIVNQTQSTDECSIIDAINNYISCLSNCVYNDEINYNTANVTFTGYGGFGNVTFNNNFFVKNIFFGSNCTYKMKKDMKIGGKYG